MADDDGLGASLGSDHESDEEDQEPGHRLLWPAHGVLKESPVYLPGDSREVAFWDVKPWRAALWPKQRIPMGHLKVF